MAAPEFCTAAPKIFTPACLMRQNISLHLPIYFAVDDAGLADGFQIVFFSVCVFTVSFVCTQTLSNSACSFARSATRFSPVFLRQLQLTTMSMDGFAVAKAIGTQHDDQRFSASFDLSPSIIATNAGKLAQCFTTDMPFLDRATVINTHTDQYIYANTATETFEVFTVPKFRDCYPCNPT
jgi:hypothetical protein